MTIKTSNGTKLSLTFAVLATTCLSWKGLAADYPAPALGEFRRGQPGIGCSQTTPQADYLACLHVGPLKIGSSVKDVESVLGKPKLTRLALGMEKRFYSTDTTNPPAWFVIVVFFKDSANEIQVTGKPAIKNLSFSSISVGDGREKIVDLLGNPSVHECVDGGPYELWAYTPFPFSFRVLNGKVAALRVVKPLGLKDPFVALDDKAMHACKNAQK